MSINPSLREAMINALQTEHTANLAQYIRECPNDPEELAEILMTIFADAREDYGENRYSAGYNDGEKAIKEKIEEDALERLNPLLDGFQDHEVQMSDQAPADEKASEESAAPAPAPAPRAVTISEQRNLPIPQSVKTTLVIDAIGWKCPAHTQNALRRSEVWGEVWAVALLATGTGSRRLVEAVKKLLATHAPGLNMPTQWERKNYEISVTAREIMAVLNAKGD